MASCPDLSELEQYVAGSLDSAATVKVREHVDGCPACFASRKQLLDEQVLAADVRRVLAGQENSDGETGVPDKLELHSAAKHFPQIEGYEILDVLGHGGMGIVYRARQTRLNRTVALKVLPAVVGTASPPMVARFRREATAAARLHHTHIVPIHDFGEAADAYYCAMELVTGQPLSTLISRFAERDAAAASPAVLTDLLRSIAPEYQLSKPSGEGDGQPVKDPGSGSSGSSSGRGRLYYRHVAQWTADVADALHYAHSQGIIHRDIKPSNLLMSVDGRIMVADFGLAKDVQASSATMTGSLLGTLRYMSPEQAMAKRMRVDHRTDIYSLGATLYELLTFVPAVPATDDREILGAIITRNPVSPRKVVSTVPRDLETICLKAMEKSPEMRFETARAMAEDLRRFISDLAITAKPPGPVERAMKFARRRKALVIAVAAVCLLAIACALLVINRGRLNATSIERFREQGQRLADTGAWAEAELQYAKVLDLDACDTPTLTKFADLKRKRYNETPDRNPHLIREAITLLDAGLECDPSDASVWSARGVMFKILEQYDRAREDYARATQLDPENAAVWVNLGIVNALRHDLGTAESDFRRATELAKDSFTRLHAWRAMAALQLHQGNPSAWDSAERARQAEPRDVATNVLLASLSLAAGDRDAAINAIVYADGLAEQRSATAKRVRALVYLAGGEFEKAIENARAALDLDGFPAINHLILAVAEAKLGDSAAARDRIKQVDQTWPPELREEGSFLASAPRGELWFETQAELMRLYREASAAIEASEP